MSRFTGFQSGDGVAVLDTHSGELVFYPFNGDPPTVLRQAASQSDDAPAAEARPRDQSPAVEVLEWAQKRDASEGDVPKEAQRLRPERRLANPKPMVIRNIDAEEIAARKAARLSRLADFSIGVGSEDEL